uniref:Uncharacterized protein n=1 Tax=Knipowitschia caucasica TaxID=637954 RepID=A0AAV2KBJ4_KNICA
MLPTELLLPPTGRGLTLRLSGLVVRPLSAENDGVAAGSSICRKSSDISNTHVIENMMTVLCSSLSGSASDEVMQQSACGTGQTLTSHQTSGSQQMYSSFNTKEYNSPGSSSSEAVPLASDFQTDKRLLSKNRR